MNKRNEFVFGLSSLIGLVITVALTAYAIANQSYAPEASAMIVSLGAINLILAILVVRSLMKVESAARELAQVEPLSREKTERIQKLEETLARSDRELDQIGSTIHNIQDQLRDRMHELLAVKESIDADDPPSTTELVDLHRTNEMFYLFVVNNLKTAMDILTGDNCAISIKLIAEGESGLLMLKTFMRDASSYRARKGADSSAVEYPYYENTAFYEIMSGEQRNYFASDNLSAETTYINSNRNWRKLYNATLVCPIRMQMIRDEETDSLDYSVIGFVCVDNMRGGLTKPASVEFLASVTDSLYNHFLLFTYISEAIGDGEADGDGATPTPQAGG